MKGKSGRNLDLATSPGNSSGIDPSEFTLMETAQWGMGAICP